MKVKCPYCLKTFRNLYNLKNHFRQVHRDVDYCVICNKQFKSFLGLMTHIRNRSDTLHLALGLLIEVNNSRFIKRLKQELDYNLKVLYDTLKRVICRAEPQENLNREMQYNVIHGEEK